MFLEYQKPEPNEPKTSFADVRMWTILGVGLFTFFLAWGAIFSRPSYGPQAQQDAARLDIHNLAEAFTDFEKDNGRYPTTAEGMQALVEPPAGATMPNWQKILERAPLDPWGHPYIYTAPAGPGQLFKILSFGPDGKPGGGDDISN